MGAPLVGATVGSFLLIPAYLALFIMGRDPNGDSSWGWCLESVLSGLDVGTLYGVIIGGGIGFVVQAIRGPRLRRAGRVGVHEWPNRKNAEPEI
jgi:hypothetical protein